ncbi:hypothetical protein F4804DRAFT_335093 [Jackrogersella minutella]|nr:hypothetical protein F4804DRAFT_335093 [Jackrogersella minutella]
MSSNGWPRLRHEEQDSSSNSYGDDTFMERMRRRLAPRDKATDGKLPQRQTPIPPMMDMSNTLGRYSYDLDSEVPPPVAPKVPLSPLNKALPPRPTEGRDDKELLPSQRRYQRGLTTGTVKWPFQSEGDSANAASSETPLRRRNAIKGRGNSATRVGSGKRSFEDRPDSPPYSPLEALARDPHGDLARRNSERNQGAGRGNRTSWYPGTPLAAELGLALAPLRLPPGRHRSNSVPSRPKTPKTYKRRPFDEPALPNILDQLRNAGQTSQKMVKIHAMAAYRLRPNN